MPPSAKKSRENKTSRGRYTSKACEECRRRRAKCDGERPSCSRCVDRDIPCQYSGVEDGRKPAPKSYVLLLRERITSLENLLRKHGIDPNSADHAIPDELTEHIPHDGQITDGNDSALEDLCGTFEGCLTLDDSLNFDQDGEMRYFGPTSGRLQFPLSGADLNLPGLGKSHIDGYSDLADAGISTDLQSELIDLYFKWEGPIAPIVDEGLFRASLVNKTQSFSPLLLNCILAVGSRFSDDVHVRSDPNNHNTAGKMFLEKARIFLYYELEKPSLTTIQSLHIMGMVYYAMGADSAGWLHTGMANRLALDMGLNMDPSAFEDTTSISTQEIEQRRRIYWTLYCHDKLSASYFGRVCSFLDCQGAVNMPSDPFLNALIGLCQILEKILCSLWGLKPSLRVSERPPFLRTCMLRLRSWFYDLPPSLRIDQPNDLPQAYTLHMIYYTTRILLAKRFLADPTHRHTPNDESTTQATPLARSICNESARSYCSVAYKYRQQFGGFRLSPLTATYCTLSAALVFLGDIHRVGEMPNSRASLELCLKVLYELAPAWSPACHIFKNLQRLYQKSIDPDPSTTGIGEVEPALIGINDITVGDSLFTWPGDMAWLQGTPYEHVSVFPTGPEFQVPNSFNTPDINGFDPLLYDCRTADCDLFELLSSEFEQNQSTNIWHQQTL
ncbi:hypothetical protein ASPWEDRAFT_122319 [Aspergillus wentii DTO 134E9]|uniref:Zn(2)-C6 fungal-type domain-containing protein n=1 Tax=Aspergillus wentii DTO 134E9 TaxID=1073089 RepID=A0A1L9R502_ASPWE|nr:uncharacterized protein ASPWEDRAFT_122319 [Aspergillus wentii DTO 134E9]OJJ29984.1 hypothetical protein ASPWEDRAFT_122319 [Aspergillus wentii DTO 134E9]